MNHSHNSHKWSLLVFRITVYSHRPRNVLYFPLKQTQSMNLRGSNPTNNHSNSLPWLCITLRTNVILGSNRNHRSNHSYPNRRKRSRHMNLRRALSLPTNTKPILLPTLRTTNCNRSSSPNSPNPIARKRIFKSLKYQKKHGQSKI